LKHNILKDDGNFKDMLVHEVIQQERNNRVVVEMPQEYLVQLLEIMEDTSDYDNLTNALDSAYFQMQDLNYKEK